MFRTLVGLLLGTFLACGHRVVTTEPAPSSWGTQFSWTGKSVEEVTARWGEPDARVADGRGGWVLCYQGRGTCVDETPKAREYTATRSKLPDPTDPTAGRNDYGAQKDPFKHDTVTIQNTEVRARFWIDGEGRVYRFWLPPEAYRKGTADPAAPRSDTDEVDDKEE